MTGGGYNEVQEPRTDEGWRGLPDGIAVAGFDSGLRITAAGGEADPRRVVGHRLADALDALEHTELEAAAVAALEGSPSTVACRTRVEGHDLAVRLSGDGAGGGTALWLDVSGFGFGANAQRERAEELELISIAARELARSTYSDEVRATICQAGLSVCGADRAVLLEPDPDGDVLRATVSVDADADDVRLPLNESSGPALAMRTNAARFSPDASVDTDPAARFAQQIGATAILWQPVARGRTVRGVLVLGWSAGLAALAPRTARLVEVVAIEAAVAIDRGSAFGRLVAMARTDTLTGLPNRRSWEDDLRRELARAGREDSVLAVAMIDLDGFKQLNDSRGHPAGDRVLELTAEAWGGQIRATDTLARYGGDEFSLVLPQCDLQRAEELLHRLREGPGLGVGFCAGVVSWDGSETPVELIERVDRSLYAAKERGQGAIIVG